VLGAGPCVVTMSAATTVTADFTLQSFVLTVGAAGNGGGSVYSNPAGIDSDSGYPSSFASGTTVTLSATAAANSIFMGGSGGGCSGPAPGW
jgi:hypothetical protein